MKNIRPLFVVLLIILGMCAPVLAEPQGQDILTGVKNITVVMPTTGTALMGSKESMADYQNYLNDCTGVIISLSNQILVIFGQEKINWNVPNGVGKTTTKTTTAQSSAAPISPKKTPVQITTSEVLIKNNAFSSPSLTVKAGSTIKWTNKDNQWHRLQFNKNENSPKIAYDDTYSRVFTDPGIYYYTCMDYPSMHGIVTVT